MINIYVDGSFINGISGYGAVILKGNEVLEKLSGSLTDKKYTSIRQVSGELFAVIISAEWCIKNKFQNVNIFYDYKGIECWVTGEWKAKNSVTREYADFIRNSGLKIKWHKVAAHTGDKWNEEADRLAKNGIQGKDVKIISEVKSDSAASALESFCSLLMDYLDERKYYSVFEGVFNDMYGRLEILDEENRRLGIIDVYKTLKKNFTPDFRAFKDKKAEMYLRSLYDSVRDEILLKI
ncbi:MAG: hypothetical protein JW982_14425 [Spirochaetes bacterium]|nr:hypothetical protein [Spirochaetota bacterium]